MISENPVQKNIREHFTTQHPLFLPESVSDPATTPTMSTTISPESDSTIILYFSIWLSEFKIRCLGFKNQKPFGAGLPGPSIWVQVLPSSTLRLIPLIGFFALVTWKAAHQAFDPSFTFTFKLPVTRSSGHSTTAAADIDLTPEQKLCLLVILLWQI